MAKGIYVGVSNLTRKIKKVYVGVNGVTRKVKKVYIGDANGLTRLAWSSVEPFSLVFTASQVWTVPAEVTKIDVFVVGAGGSGGSGSAESDTYSTRGGGGGGGGYTTAYKNLIVVPGQQIAVSIGAGARYNKGGTSSFGSIQAYGGESGNSYGAGNGGSGGGRGSENSRNFPSSGGSDGNDGAVPYMLNNQSQVYSGVGQHTTTRAFAEANETLYAGGGGGGDIYSTYSDVSGNQFGSGGEGGGGGGGQANNYGIWSGGDNGSPNTGGGGGGGSARRLMNSRETTLGGIGGSGVVIVRFNG